MQTQVLGLSVDSIPSLKAWAESLGGITYPLLSDFFPHGAVARRYGVLRRDGTSERALFVIDKSGILRHASVLDMDKQPDNDALIRSLCEMDPQAAAWQSAHSLPSSTQEPADDVVMYCTSWCPSCRLARAWLQEHGIRYTEIDITLDRASAERVRGWAGGFETTPTFKIHGQVLVGFERFKLAPLLGIEPGA
jgi:glutaredoxin